MRLMLLALDVSVVMLSYKPINFMELLVCFETLVNQLIWQVLQLTALLLSPSSIQDPISLNYSSHNFSTYAITSSHRRLPFYPSLYSSVAIPMATLPPL